jgi:hypothetical protein
MDLMLLSDLMERLMMEVDAEVLCGNELRLRV